MTNYDIITAAIDTYGKEHLEEPTMEKFMQGQDPGDPEDGSL